MNWTDLLLRLRALARHRRAESELDEELSFHLEMEARKNLAAGMTGREAQVHARAQFGGVEQAREECRDVRGLTLLENLARDARYGTRVLRRTPAFAAIAVLSLAIGIGANTAVFSILDTVLLRMLPVRNPEQLVVARWGAHAGLDISTTWSTSGDDGHGGWVRNVFTWPMFTQMRANSRTLDALIGFSPLGPVNTAANGQAFPAGAMVVSGNYFHGLGVNPILGRPITDDDDAADGVPAAVISYRFWDRAYALDPAVIGKILYVNGAPCSVIGVAPKEFYGVSPGGFSFTPNVDIMLPIRARDRLEGTGGHRLAWFSNDLFWVQAMARLKPEYGVAPAKSELSAWIAANLTDANQRALKSEAPRIYLDPGSQGLDQLRSTYNKPLWILMAVVGMTLLMACANLAGLLLARATARQNEIALRLAIGATRGRLVRQLLVEGAVLSAAGTLAGLAFAWWGVRALLALVATSSTPISVAVSPDARVLGFTAAVALATTFLFALAPAVRATRTGLATAASKHSFGAGRALVAVQVAVALVLLAGATLFTRSLANLRSLPLGFNPHNLVLFDLAPGKNGYDAVRGTQLYANVLDRVKQIPGVTGASLSAQRLIRGYVSNGNIRVAGAVKRSDSHFNFVGPDFLAVMGMPLILGRGIELRDLTGPPVAVINEALARSAFPGGSPVGRRFRYGWRKDGADIEVIGVVKDAKYARLRDEVPPTLYAPFTQTVWGWPQEMSFEVRTAGSAAPVVGAIRRAVAEIDRMLPLTDVKTQDAQIDDSLSKERLFASLVSLFGAIALVLACVGLYGSVSYAVTRRTRELGVRMALGAGRGSVLRMLLGQVAATIAAGLVLGLPATWALTKIIGSQLYGITPHDPLSLAAASAGVVAVALIAAFLPARRATRIDPVSALRYE